MDDNILQELALIILNYKNYDMTIQCVNNLISLNINAKIIVVDNNSPNDSYEQISKSVSSFDNVYLLKTERNGGYSYGNNEGIRFANKNFSGIKYIGIMNPDVFLNTKAMLTKICNKLAQRSDLAGITGVTLLNGKLVFNNLGWRVNDVKSLILANSSLLSKVLKISKSYSEIELDKDDCEIGYTEVMPGSFFIMKNDIFKEFGYLDENVFLYFEEDILGRKIKKRDLKSAILISESYIHKHDVKDNELSNVKKKKLDYKIYMKSQTYYVKNYIGNNWINNFMLKISQYVHLYLEIPLICSMYKLKKAIRK
ncbi:glycosyltransferase family 2 protein [Clostridium sp. YIM B02505]|uniref:Glycosyltransferase family 2 protein n=1 Tax=Clostridium yunnanense TaxID=2800325 RepID=A0ABS1ELQ1_9CLOT|nr:glycosyltransferase [Clostridium yunnanense]MBK1810282.1 glycosyltransferase family 2 protein [Clostridium yunnanense]